MIGETLKQSHFAEFQLNISKHVGVSVENCDGQTDGRTETWTDITIP